MELNLIHLYPDLLNIYGDTGNIQAITYRCSRRGIKVNLRSVTVSDRLTPGSFDLVFGGGGQDSQQVIVSHDLPGKTGVLIRAARAGVPMLAICGTYQLFGDYFKPFAGPKLTGIGLFPAHTVASKIRKIGNIIIKTGLGRLIGFENHSGNTYLNNSRQALGTVIRGHGNNGQDRTEGCRFNQVFGTYLHGPLLPKNPALTDYLIQTALALKYNYPVKLSRLDDSLEWQARQAAGKIAHGPGCWNR